MTKEKKQLGSNVPEGVGGGSSVSLVFTHMDRESPWKCREATVPQRQITLWILGLHGYDWVP